MLRAAGGEPLGRLPSPPPLTHLCLWFFSAPTCFCAWLRDLQLLLQLAAGAFRVSGCGIVVSRTVKLYNLRLYGGHAAMQQCLVCRQIHY